MEDVKESVMEKVVEEVKEKRERVKKTPDKPVESREGNGVEAGSYEVTIDNSLDEVVELNSKGYVLSFSVDSFLELDDDTLDKLSRRNFASYFVSKARVEDVKLSKVRRPDPDYVKDWELKALGGNAKQRMASVLRKRKGWHGFLAAPDEVEERKSMGYRVIRTLSKEQQKLVDSGKKKVEDFVGEEGGPVAKLGQEDKPELVAMEIPEQVWKDHLAAVGWKSRGRWEQNQQSYMDKIERAGLKPRQFGDEEMDRVEVGNR